MKTQVTSCDSCMETITDGGFSLYGWQDGVTEYVDLDCCSVRCLGNAVAELMVTN